VTGALATARCANNGQTEPYVIAVTSETSQSISPIEYAERIPRPYPTHSEASDRTATTAKPPDKATAQLPPLKGARGGNQNGI